MMRKLTILIIGVMLSAMPGGCRRVNGEDGEALRDEPDSESEGAGEMVFADRGSDTDYVAPDTGTEAPADSDTEMDSDTGFDTESKAVCMDPLYDLCCLEVEPKYKALCDRYVYDLDPYCAYHYCCVTMEMWIAQTYFQGCMVGPHCGTSPFCGDGEINQDDEECDDGNTIPGDGCNGICKIESYFNCPTPGAPCISYFVCGNGVLDQGEACDDGNTTSDDGCSSDCGEEEPCFLCRIPGRPCETFAGLGLDCPADPFCGDGKVNLPAEECDDYFNIGGYGQCAPGCVQGERCGDGIVQGNAGETCDEGAGNGAYGKCNTQCNGRVGCGDGILHSSYGEECDDGINDGGYDGCTPDCLRAPHCGDGILQPSYETCDDGDENGAYGKCNRGCAAIVGCGDGIRQPEEACDDGNEIEDDFCDSRCRCSTVV